jgi:hypothetical protein
MGRTQLLVLEKVRFPFLFASQPGFILLWKPRFSFQRLPTFLSLDLLHLESQQYVRDAYAAFSVANWKSLMVKHPPN